MIKTFKEFARDYKKYYQISYVSIYDEDEMKEDLLCIYGTQNFEIDYENRIIELF